jgi:hypothetical protein
MWELGWLILFFALMSAAPVFFAVPSMGRELSDNQRLSRMKRTR